MLRSYLRTDPKKMGTGKSEGITHQCGAYTMLAGRCGCQDLGQNYARSM